MLPPLTLCKITSNCTGAGFYNARRQIRKSTPVFDPTTNLSMSTYYQDVGTLDDVFVVNDADSGGGHSLSKDDYRWCIIAGPSTGATPRVVMSVVGGGATGIFIVTSNGPRGGMYNASPFAVVTTKLSISGNAPTSFEIGSASPSGVYLLNSPEIDKPSSEPVQWDLKPNRIAEGSYLMPAADNTPVYLISEYSWVNCP